MDSPQVTTDGAGNWIAVWESSDYLGGTIGRDYDVLVSRSADAGVTWTDPAPVNTNANSDSGWDYRPQITTDGAGNWVAVWESRDSLDGTIGTDYDILFARFSGIPSDHGDAPAPYPTLLAEDGARHHDTRPRLGTRRDVEPDGRPEATGQGDDHNGMPDDEDGVSFLPLIPGQTAAMAVFVDSGGGVVEAWVDFNRDGVWQHPAERVFAGLLADGIHQVPFAVPPDAVPGTSFARVRISSQGGLAPAGLVGDGEVEDYEVTVNGVVARHVFYDNSQWDGNTAGPNTSGGPFGNGDDGAIAPDKTPLLPGQTATFANYTSYTRGINGIMVDVANLPNPSGIDAADFVFRVGNDDAPGGWPTAPGPTSVSVRVGAGDGGSDRVTIIFADNTIGNQWLQVTVLANADTGLVQNHVFYAGNLIGDTDGNFVVNIGDMYAVYLGLGEATAVDDPLDFDRNGTVLIGDMYAVYLNSNSTLQEFTAPVALLSAVDAALADWPDPQFEKIRLYGLWDDPDDSQEDERLKAPTLDPVYVIYAEI